MSNTRFHLNNDSSSKYELVYRRHASADGVYAQINTDKPHLKVRSTRLQRSTWQKAVVHLWLWEWLAWFVALLAIAAIVGVLLAFDNKSISEWPYGITLGALVCVLATIATIGLAQPLAAGLGQARWIWYTENRRLADLELIDSASKGPIGSVLLVLKGKGG